MTRLPRRAQRIGAIALAVLALGLQHCASEQSRFVGDNSSTRQDSDGLEVMRWTTTKDTSTLEGILIGFQKRQVMNPLATESLLQEGFFSAIIDEKDLPQIREKLGSSTIDIRTTYGTLPHWREVLQRTIPSGQALVVNGATRIISSQLVQMTARGWTTPTESGGCFQLEIATSLLDVSKEQQGMFGRADRPPGIPIMNTGIETCLQRDEVLIVLTANQGPFQSGRGPGSQAALPPTAGGFLLGESADLQGKETSMKGVTLLAFVPHISSSIQPIRIPAAAVGSN